MLKTIMALLWEPLKQPPKEVINHQKKKKKALHSIYKKKLPVNSELLMSGERGRQGFSLTWRKQFTNELSSFFGGDSSVQRILFMVSYFPRRCAQHCGVY